MTCDELEQYLHPYLDGEFDPESRIEVDEHLAECGPCASRVHAEAQFLQAVRLHATQKEPTRAPDALRSRLRDNLASEQRREVRASWVRLSAAAAVALVIGGGTWHYQRLSAKKRYLEAAVHRHTKGHPLEITQQPHENVEAWFDGKLDHHVRVPHLPNVQLAGARLSNVQDKQAAYIRYELPTRSGAAPRPVGLFVFDDTDRAVRAEPLPQIQLDTSNGYNVAVWRDGAIVYELVTDLDEEDIRRMLTGSHTRPGAPQRSGMTVQPAAFQQ